jgi:hypothetical protein
MLKIEWQVYHFSSCDFGFARAFEVTIDTGLIWQQFRGHAFVTVDPYKGKAKGGVICNHLGAMPVISLTTAFGADGQQRPHNSEMALLDLECQIKARIKRLLRDQKL